MNRIGLEFWKDARIWAISSALLVNCLLMLIVPHGQTFVPWRHVAGGLLFFFVTEYVVHRYLLHGFMSFLIPGARSGHDEHHQNPGNLKYMLTPNSFNIPFHIALTALFSFLFGSMKLGGAFMAGFSVYQLYYEWCHFVTHRPIVPLTPLGKWMKKHHLLHHYKDAAHFYGVTHPVWDYALGSSGSGKTNPPQKQNHTSSM